MYQVRNFNNCRNVTNDPSHNVDASEDFYHTVVETYILNAAIDMFMMKSLYDTPVDPNIFSGIENANLRDKREAILQASRKVVAQYVDISFTERKKDSEADGVYSYTCEVISLGLLLLEFNDGIHEGNGDRILRCWKLFFPIFKASKRKNNAIEAFELLCQYNFLFYARNGSNGAGLLISEEDVVIIYHVIYIWSI